MTTNSWPRQNATLTIAHTWDGHALAPDEWIFLELELDDDALVITVDAPFHDDPPPHGPARSLDGLWNHEVVELFVAGRPEPGGEIPYTEIELSPHGHFLVLRLLGARNLVQAGLLMELTTRLEIQDESAARWRAQARLPVAHLPPAPWRVNAYAIHGTGKERRYLAMIPVPGSAPDFHQPEVFRLVDLHSGL